MKKTINNKKYNTETAKYVGEFKTEDKDITDDYYLSEVLYRKTTGEFFLYCQGGPRTMYGKKIQGVRMFSETIDPLSFEDAKSWGKQHLDEETYNDFFDMTGKYDTSDEQEYKTFKISTNYIKKLEKMHSESGKSYGEIITMLIDNMEKK